MRNRVVLFTGIMLGIMYLSSCSHSDSGRRIVTCDIADAKSLVVLPKGNMVSRAANVSPDILYKIDGNGELRPVTGTDDSGDDIEIPAPTAVIDISTDWLILEYDEPYADYLVNKEKGNTYIFTDRISLLRVNMGYLGFTRRSVFTDASGNFYYVSFPSGRCHKLDISDENKVTLSAYTPDIYFISGVDEFCVDSSGNVMFSYYDEMQRTAMKIMTASGRLINLDEPVSYSFAGYDGALYGNKFKYTIENNELKKESYGLNEDDSYSYGGGDSQSRIWFYFDDSIWVTGSSMNTFVELYNKDPSVQPSARQVQELAGETVTNVAQNATSIFAVTRSGKIYRFDIKDSVVSKVFDNGDYEIHTFSVTDEGLIQFSALNLQNSHKILATVGADGKVTVLGDNLEDDVTILQRIR